MVLLYHENTGLKDQKQSNISIKLKTIQLNDEPFKNLSIQIYSIQFGHNLLDMGIHTETKLLLSLYIYTKEMTEGQACHGLCPCKMHGH